MPTVIALLLLLLSFWAGIVHAQDLELESNGSTAQATAISSGRQIQGSFFDSGDLDYYRLALTSRQEVTVSLSTTPRAPFSEMTITVEVFDASRSKIGGFTSEEATSVSTKLIAGPGDLYILVRGDDSYYFEGSLTYSICWKQ